MINLLTHFNFKFFTEWIVFLLCFVNNRINIRKIMNEGPKPYFLIKINTAPSIPRNVVQNEQFVFMARPY